MTTVQHITIDEAPAYIADGWEVKPLGGHRSGLYATAIKADPEPSLSGSRVVGFAGRKGSGKSTAAGAFPASCWTRLNFADPLKRMLWDGGILTDEEAWGEHKERPIGWLDGVTPRWVMQSLGTNWGRDLIHHDLWVKLWRRNAEAAVRLGHGVVAADVRFPNETAAVRDLGGPVIWIERPGMEAADDHVSENSIEDHDCDAIVVNEGPILSFHSHVWAAIDRCSR